MRILLLLVISASAWGACASSPYANGYGFCREIVIDHTKVPSTQTNYPMVVCFGATMGANCSANTRMLATAANGGKLLNSAGYDFIFTSDNAGTTPIAYERVIQDTTTGVAELWVLIASLSSSVDTSIYLFYSNPSISTDQSSPTAVWDSNYLAVHHFNAITGFYTATLPDSTGANDMTINMSPVPFNTKAIPGVVGGAADIGYMSCGACGFTNQGPYTNFPPTGSPAPFTLEGWFNTNGIVASDGEAYCFGNDAVNGDRWAIFYSGTMNTWAIEGRNAGVTFPGGTTGWHRIVTILPSGQTTFINGKVYLDGVSQTLTNPGSGTVTFAPTYTGANGYTAGILCGRNSPINQYLGFMDELRLSKTERSQDWVTTDYNNQSNPATFYSLGTQVPPEANNGRTIIVN